MNTETIAVGPAIRELANLKKRYGDVTGEKKGVTMILLEDGTRCKAEIHRYEAHGVGKVKVKRWARDS